MFSVQRYDASRASDRGEGSSNGAGKLDRIALINQRKAALHVSPTRDYAAAVPSAAETANPAPNVNASGPALTIHPSRLAISHTLRQAAQKAKALASGINKEKTKAKQRYLKTKKDRRKKRKAVEIKRDKKSNYVAKVDAQPAEEVECSDDDSDSETTIDEKEVDVVSPAVEKQEAPSSTVKKATFENNLADGSGPLSSTSEDASDGDASSMDEDVGEAGKNVDEPVQDRAERDGGMEVDAEVAVLSRFPAPKRTLQASRRDLAAQGLPNGLANPQRVDPALSQSIKQSEQDGILDHISPAMKAKLAKLNITQWFAVQTAVIPLLLSRPQSKSLYPNPPLADLCVSAPTGSGKTLSYAVPIVEVLGSRICRQLRALIILPTRDLVNQVKETMTQIAKGTLLSIAAITGQQGFAQEQALLVDNVTKQKVAGMMEDADADENKRESTEDEDERRSKVDILIATPGRLIDHLNQTPGFTLQHLRFLVIDEADRLLGQSFQEWLPRVLDGLDPAKDPKVLSERAVGQGLAPAWLQHRKRLSSVSDAARTVLVQENEWVGVQKLLFSATLTRDPAKILALQLRNAAFISVEEEQGADEGQWGTSGNNFIDRQESFALPATLTEHMIVTKGQDKPLDLLHLLYGEEHRLRQVLCFTKSVDNAARLVKLIDFFNESSSKEDQVVIKEYSSDLNGLQRSRILQSFKDKKIDVLVCSDVMARGIDLPDVRHVISYDAPIDMAKYVHRVGRTARANRQGDAWTMVEEQEARHFKTMMKRGGRRAKVDKVKIKPEQRESLQSRYDEAISQLQSFFSR